MKNNCLSRFLVLSLLLVIGLPKTQAQIYINEVMQSNLNIVMDDLNDYPDSWVELYNAGTDVVNLKDYGLSVKSKYANSYKLPSYNLHPQSYLIIYCDKEGKELHADFRLESGSKGNIYLFDASGTQIDAILNMDAMPSPDVAYGRTQDGGDAWSYLVTPTPGGSNNTSVVSDVVLPEPVFSVAGGLYTSTVLLSIAQPSDELSNVPADAVVRYTTNGSEPTISSPVLHPGALLTINTTTVVRAKLFSSSAVSRMSTTHSYIFHGRNVTLPVIATTTDRKNFYDNKIGIYTTGTYSPGIENFRYNWRRPINFEYFDDDSEAVLNQLCETRVSGGGSREAPMKSLIVYSNKRFGTNRFGYPLFPDKPEVPIKSFIMRNAGNDFCWGHFRDAAIQLISVRGGMDIDWQAYQPTIWYLNGSYMGIINLRERSNEDHIYSNYNKLEDIDMFENWYELKAGDWVHYDAFKEFYTKTDNSYEEYEQWMDVSEFMNMFIINTYHVNLDFPGNNIVMWRPRTDDGRWRWIIKDTDFGLGLYGRDANYNYLNFILRTGSHEENWANTWDATRLFRRIIGNERFKQEFIDRFAVAMGDYLCASFGGTIIDSLKNNIEYEYTYHRRRYADYNAWLNWNDEVNGMKTWMSNRTTNMYNHLKSYFNLGTITFVKVNTENVDADKVDISFNENKLSRGIFDGRFFVGREIRLNASSKETDKQVTGWNVMKVVRGTRTTEQLSGNVLSYTAPEGCTYLSFDPILEEVTGIVGQQAGDWQVQTTSTGVHLINLTPGSLITVFDVSGCIFYSQRAVSDTQTVVLPSRNDTYLIKVVTNNRAKTKKVVLK